MRVRCYSVRLASLERLSPKAYKAVAFDGSCGIIPASQIFGVDESVSKSDAYWISAWILRQRHIQYSCKKSATFDSDTRRMVPDIIIERHHPDYVRPVDDNTITDLKSD